MSPKYKYHSAISLFLAFVLAWNSFGFLATELVRFAINELHSSHETCEISFCYCEVSDGVKICMCHHKELHDDKSHTKATKNHHSQGSDYCILNANLTTDHSDLMVLSWDSRIFLTSKFGLIKYQTDSDVTIPILEQNILEGIHFSLFRPPIVA